MKCDRRIFWAKEVFEVLSTAYHVPVIPQRITLMKHMPHKPDKNFSLVEYNPKTNQYVIKLRSTYLMEGEWHKCDREMMLNSLCESIAKIKDQEHYKTLAHDMYIKAVGVIHDNRKSIC